MKWVYEELSANDLDSNGKALIWPGVFSSQRSICQVPVSKYFYLHVNGCEIRSESNTVDPSCISHVESRPHGWREQHF